MKTRRRSMNVMGRPMFGYVRLHRRSLEETEDLLLEVFLAALEHDNLALLPPGEQLAWWREVAQNKLANAYRQVARHPQVAPDAIVEPIFAADGPELLLLQKEERSQLDLRPRYAENKT